MQNQYFALVDGGMLIVVNLGSYKGIHGILLNHNWHVLPFVEIKIRPLHFNRH